jgi:hypothetical protein
MPFKGLQSEQVLKQRLMINDVIDGRIGGLCHQQLGTF